MNWFSRHKFWYKIRRNIVIYIVFVIFLFICLYPLYFVLVSSFKDNTSIFQNPIAFPASFRFDNYVRALVDGHIALYFRNSLILTASTLLVVFFVGSIASYILAKFKFRLRSAIYLLFISGLMIPIQSTIIPLSYTFGMFHLKNSYPVLILLFTAFQLPITILIVTGFMKSIPVEFEEAAVMDGASVGNVFFKIILPLAMPGIVTALTFDFLNVWNNLLFPLVFISDQNMQVIATGLLSFFSQFTSDYGGLMAAIAISIFPPIVMYMLLQEKVEKGLTAGGVKG